MEVITTYNLFAGLKDLGAIRHFVETELAPYAIDPAILYDIIFSVNEIITNVLVHGYPAEEGWIEVSLARDQHDLYITIRDRAPAFDPTTLTAPDISLPLEQRPLGGMGVYLTKELMDQVTHCHIPEGGNELVLIKHAVV